MEGFTGHIILPVAGARVLPNRPKSAKKIGANIIVLCSFKYTIPLHTAFLGNAFCVMDEI